MSGYGDKVNDFEKSKSNSKEGEGELSKLFFDVVVISIGLILSSFGTALFYAAKLGASPMATFSDGVHTLLNISYGTANGIVNFVFLIILYFIKKKYINVGTVLCVFTIGIYVNLFTELLVRFDISGQHMVIRIGSIILGTFLMGTGLGLYVAVDRGFGPLEALVKLLCAKTNKSYTVIKIVQDVVLVTGGVFLGARIGVGTVIAVFMTGPVLQYSIKFFQDKI